MKKSDSSRDRRIGARKISESQTRHKARVSEKEVEANESVRAKGRKEAGRKRRGAKERRRARRTRTSERREGRKKGPSDVQETSSSRTWKTGTNKSAGEPLKMRTRRGDDNGREGGIAKFERDLRQLEERKRAQRKHKEMRIGQCQESRGRRSEEVEEKQEQKSEEEDVEQNDQRREVDVEERIGVAPNMGASAPHSQANSDLEEDEEKGKS